MQRGPDFWKNRPAGGHLCTENLIFGKNNPPEAAFRAEHQGFVPKMDIVFQKWFAGGSFSSGAPRFCPKMGASGQVWVSGEFRPKSKISKLVRNGPKWSQMAPDGPKTSQKMFWDPFGPKFWGGVGWGGVGAEEWYTMLLVARVPGASLGQKYY